MEHKMNLVSFAFNAIKRKEKKYEIRLNDLKRQNIKVGDIIVFNNINTLQKVKTKVVSLNYYNNFKELFDNYDNKDLGLSDDVDYTIMDKFYSKEEQDKYQALAIEIEVI